MRTGFLPIGIRTTPRGVSERFLTLSANFSIHRRRVSGTLRPHHPPHPPTTTHFRPRIHARPIRPQTPTGSPLAQSFDLVARSGSHGHDILCSLNERHIQEGCKPAARFDFSPGRLGVTPDRSREGEVRLGPRLPPRVRRAVGGAADACPSDGTDAARVDRNDPAVLRGHRRPADGRGGLGGVRCPPAGVRGAVC